MNATYARLFGGIFSRIEEMDNPQIVSSEMYSRAIKMLDSFMENYLNPAILEPKLVDWIDSKVLDCFQVPYGGFSKVCSEGHFELVKWFLEKHPTYLQRDWEPFSNVCKNGHLEMVRWMSKFIEPETRFQTCLTYSLSLTCRNGHLKVVEFLLEKFMFKNAPLILSFACESGNLDLVAFIADHPKIRVENPSNAFATACSDGYLEIAKWILEKYSIDAYSVDYAFGKACLYGHAKVVKWWLDRFSDTDVEYHLRLPVRVKCLKKPLRIALLEVQPEIAKILGLNSL